MPIRSVQAYRNQRQRRSWTWRQLIVKWKPNIRQAERLNTYKRNGDTFIQSNPKLGCDLIRVRDKVRDARARYQNQASVKYAHPNYRRTYTFTPDDPYFNLQWGLMKISAPDAWNTTMGGEDTIIAILDSGIQPDHPDLSTKLIPGRNFVGGDATDTNDEVGHGTAVAGIAAAITNNGIGVAGTCPTCKIMPIKVGNEYGVDIFAEAMGLIFAADNGANIVNMSFGGSYTSGLEEEACQYAASKGVVLIASAGNEGNSEPQYPANFPTVIAVAATDENDTKASFSSYGTWVDVAAPGVEIVTTYIGSEYASLNGTSMSAPFVSGVAGLLSSQGLNNTQIRNKIQNTADRISGTGDYWKYGRINAQRAVTAPTSGSVVNAGPPKKAASFHHVSTKTRASKPSTKRRAKIARTRTKIKTKPPRRNSIMKR